MVMIPIAVFDLDDTFVRGDSFRWLVRGHLTFDLALMGLARKMRLIDRAAFSKYAVRRLASFLNDRDFIASMIDRLNAAIDPAVASEAADCRAAGDTLVLVSASPAAYVVPFALQAGFNDAIGSYSEESFIHCYGPAKVQQLALKYPRSQYFWRFAVSDSPSDESWMTLFETWRLHR